MLNKSSPLIIVKGLYFCYDTFNTLNVSSNNFPSIIFKTNLNCFGELWGGGELLSMFARENVVIDGLPVCVQLTKNRTGVENKHGATAGHCVLNSWCHLIEAQDPGPSTVPPVDVRSYAGTDLNTMAARHSAQSQCVINTVICGDRQVITILLSALGPLVHKQCRDVINIVR